MRWKGVKWRYVEEYMTMFTRSQYSGSGQNSGFWNIRKYPFTCVSGESYSRIWISWFKRRCTDNVVTKIDLLTFNKTLINVTQHSRWFRSRSKNVLHLWLAMIVLPSPCISGELCDRHTDLYTFSASTVTLSILPSRQKITWKHHGEINVFKLG